MTGFLWKAKYIHRTLFFSYFGEVGEILCNCLTHVPRLSNQVFSGLLKTVIISVKHFAELRFGNDCGVGSERQSGP